MPDIHQVLKRPILSEKSTRFTDSEKHPKYVFEVASEANKKTFEANPQKYLPAFGGYCAYGVSVGKKFVGDPNVWEVVDGRMKGHVERIEQHLTGRVGQDVRSGDLGDVSEIESELDSLDSSDADAGLYSDRGQSDDLGDDPESWDLVGAVGQHQLSRLPARTVVQRLPTPVRVGHKALAGVNHR